MSGRVRRQEETDGAAPRRRRLRRAAAGRATAATGVAGGRYRPLTDADIGRIDEAARTLLAHVGLSEAPPSVIELARCRGAGLSDEGRLTFPPPLVEEALAGLRRGFALHGRGEGYELPLDGTRVHTGSGGAAPSVVDLDTGRYRDSTLADLHDAARLVDALENVHFFSRSLVARDLEDERALDVNTAYASLAGTAKHVMSSVGRAEHVADIAAICALVAGSAEAFAARPSLSLNVNHVAPPLRFAPEACEVLVAAARAGIPVQVNTFGQLGASSPVTIAGSLAQTVAETLAGMIVAWLAEPAARAVFGPRPMVTDFRTGAMSGGGGEQALLMAASVQMARHYDLPNSCIAGATDSKLADAQSGYEKALSVSLAAQAGADLVTQACGMQAGLMAVAFESYVIDNDMLGAILRSASEIEVGDATLSIDEIGRVARGEGHFLGQPQTLARMESDFLYPEIADRRSPAEWAAAGAPDIRERARARAREILATHRPPPIPADADRAIRARLDIRLPAAPEDGR